MNLDDCRKNFPDLPLQIFLFFQLPSSGPIKPNTVLDCCQHLRKFYNSSVFSQPRLIDRICRKLSESNMMTVLHQGGLDGMDSRYMTVRKGWVQEDGNLPLLNDQLSCILYGFKYVYDRYRSAILAVRFVKGETQSLGTAFALHNYLITAKHCLDGADHIEIEGISSSVLQKSKVFFHEEQNLDIAVVELPSFPSNFLLWTATGEPLDDVIALGYPKLAGFHNFVATEKAQISSRFRASTGAIVAAGLDIWSKKDLLLITAKIQGGNSGGPVINAKGEVVAVAVQITFGEGNSYDNLGYGTAIPIEYAWNEMIAEKKCIDVSGTIAFKDFETS